METKCEKLIADLSEVVQDARIGNYSLASSNLNRAIADFQLLTKTIPPQFLKKIAYSLETLLYMQQHQDWVAFADVLEFEFIPLLRDSGC